MDRQDWVIVVVGAFIALVVAVSAYESEKRLERIIKLLERERP
jgi:hydrogenase maturation factor